MVGYLSTTLVTKGIVHYELVGASLRFRVANGVLETKCDPAFQLAGYCLNYEEQRTHDVTVRATSGGQVLETTFTIKVTDEPDGPLLDVPDLASVDEYVLPYTHVGTVTLSGHDPLLHPGIRHRLEVVSDAPQAAFTLNVEDDTIETLHFGALVDVPHDAVTLRVTTSYQPALVDPNLGFGHYAIATKDVTVNIVPGTAPPPATGTNPMRFVVDSDLLAYHTMAEVEARLADYVAELNAIFAKNTSRRFTFDPTTSIRILEGDDWDVSNRPPCVRSPHHHFTVYLISSWPGSVSSGLAGCGRRGENELATVVYEVDRLCAPSQQCPGKEYEHVIFMIAHELGHNHGLADNYLFASVPDATGIAPDNSITPLNTDPNNAYWLARWLTWHDPMAPVAPTPTPLHAFEFAPTHAAIIDEYALAQIGDETLTHGNVVVGVGTPVDVDVTLIDDKTAQPISGCNVQAIRQHEVNSGYQHTALDDGTTGSDGVVTLTLEGTILNHDGVFFKASCAGYEPAGDVATGPDFTAARIFPSTNGVSGGFNTRLILRANPQ